MNILQKLCGKVTNHKFRKYQAKSVGIKPTEYHYKCKICGYRFWNYSSPYKIHEKYSYQNQIDDDYIAHMDTRD